MAERLNPSQADVGNMTDAEKQRLNMMMQGMFGERAGAASELLRLDDPEKLPDAIETMSAVAIGLAVTRRSVNVGEGKVSFINGKGTYQETFMGRPVLDRNGKQVVSTEGKLQREVSLVSDEELMQIFMSPDWLADQSGAGYMAKSTLEGAIIGAGREDASRAMLEKYSKEDAEQMASYLVEQNQIASNQKGSYVTMLQNSYNPESLKKSEVIRVLREAAPRFRSLMIFYGVFRDHQKTVGDEKAGSELFVTPGHSIPQGPDFQAILDDVSEGYSKRDRALRVIRAAGLRTSVLEAEGKEELLIEGIHYKINKKGEREILDINPYVSGWKTETFIPWMDRLVEETRGDLVAAYESWIIGIGTGLVASVAQKDGKVGDPPLVSSLDAWLMHFSAKQVAEAGFKWNKKENKWDRIRPKPYKGKTGPTLGIGKYPNEWTSSFFESAWLGPPQFDSKGNPTKTAFDAWWNDNVTIGKLPWIKIGEQEREEEVSLGSFDGWLYNKFQLFKMFSAVQGTPGLKDLGAYTFWEGMGRSVDKAFGTVYKPVADGKNNNDKEWDENCKRAKAERKQVTARRKLVTEDGTEFIQIVPDSLNPRYQLVKGIIQRYYPLGTLSENVQVDSAVARSERFSILSEINEMADPIAKLRTLQDPGTVLIENFIVSLDEASMLTIAEMYDLLNEVMIPGKAKEIFSKSPILKIRAQKARIAF